MYRLVKSYVYVKVVGGMLCVGFALTFEKINKMIWYFMYNKIDSMTVTLSFSIVMTMQYNFGTMLFLGIYAYPFDILKLFKHQFD